MENEEVENQENNEGQQSNNEGNSNNNVKIIVVSGDVSSEISGVAVGDSVLLDSQQYNDLLDKIGDNKFDGNVKIKTDQYNDLISHINSINGLVSSSVNSAVAVPEDYYYTTADLDAQTTFFLSLIFGLLISICFFMGISK